MVVAALGGNALLRRGESPGSTIQEGHVREAVNALAGLVGQGADLVLTHGNGPQVGLLALESAADTALTAPYPFDVLGAETQGMIGYWLVRALRNRFPRRRAVALITQTVVSLDDPAFSTPTKFVGGLYGEEEAHRLAKQRGWRVRADGVHWRRVVASPEPISILEESVVAELVATGTIVICAGGGGVPVSRDASGEMRGVEAVIDKDLATALLAIQLNADLLLLLTDVEAVEMDFATPNAQALSQLHVAAARALVLPPGSMGPKVEAACRFVEATHRRACVGSLLEVDGLVAGTAGTSIAP